jgi:urease accessory protein
MRQFKQDSIIIDKVLGHISELHVGNRKLDPVLLQHELLEKPHQKVTSSGGFTLGISLEMGNKLFGGAVLWVDDEVVVFVELVDEDLLEVKPSGNLEWAKVAFNIGNMHHPAYLYEEFIRIPYDEVMERMLLHLGVTYVRKIAKLDGIRANAPAGNRTSHPHSHSSNHHDHPSGSNYHDHHEG